MQEYQIFLVAFLAQVIVVAVAVKVTLICCKGTPVVWYHLEEGKGYRILWCCPSRRFGLCALVRDVTLKRELFIQLPPAMWRWPKKGNMVIIHHDSFFGYGLRLYGQNRRMIYYYRKKP